MVGVRSHLRTLIKRGKIKQFKDNKYGIKKATYKHQSSDTQKPLSKSIKQQLRILRILPFVKTVATASNSPQLIVVTSPNRVYLTKTLLDFTIKLLNKKLAYEEMKNNFQPIFYTTAGIRFTESMGYDEISRVLWFILAQPLYKQSLWHKLLKNNTYLYTHLPNLAWRPSDGKIVTSMSKLLDDYDNRQYRNYLREMASITEYQTQSALLRIRPDIFIAITSHHQDLDGMKKTYLEVRAKI